MKNLQCLLLVTALAAAAMPTLPAQEVPKNKEAIRVSGTNEDGFPLQGLHVNEPLIAQGHPASAMGTFIWVPDRALEMDGREGAIETIFKKKVGIPIPAKITITGAWKLAADNVRNPITAKDSRQISVTNSIEVTEEAAHEISASAALMVGGGNDTVKAELTVTAGYAYTASHGKAVGESWTHTVGVAPGQGLQGWQRLMKVTYDFDTRTAYKNRDEFVQALATYWGPILLPGNESVPNSYAWHKKMTGPKAALGFAMGATGAPVMDFEKFKRIGKVTVVHEIPYPEFYATYYQIPKTGHALEAKPTATVQDPAKGIVPVK
jgi:hypothetical protein